jgi:hypothetical protein
MLTAIDPRLLYTVKAMSIMSEIGVYTPAILARPPLHGQVFHAQAFNISCRRVRVIVCIETSTVN